MGETPRDEDRAEPILRYPPAMWFHGSPLRLSVAREGSTVTPVVELARAFSHKPTRLAYTVTERDGVRTTAIEHDGVAHGYLYHVVVADPSVDLVQHPTSLFARGEEMLAARELPLELIEEAPVEYEPITVVEGPAPGAAPGK